VRQEAKVKHSPLDLDTETPPEVTTDDLDFTDFDEDSETKEDIIQRRRNSR
jgi:hypothetical protein